MDEVRIIRDDLSGEEIQALIAFHLNQMHANSPACKVHAMPVSRLREADVTFWSAWIGSEIAGMGAMKQLDAGHGELKSMRVAPEWLGKGVGQAILRHLIAVARSRGYGRVSLETGRTEAFLPAISLYRKHGFAECEAFGDYVSDDFSQCMTLAL